MGFWSTILLSASISAIAATGLFLQIRSGQLNVGMAVFVGVGGYVSGALSTTADLPLAITFPVAILTGFLVGCAFSAITLRLSHWFFSVTTLTLSVAAVSGVGMIDVFGGGIGLMGIPIVDSPIPIIVGLLLTSSIAYAIDHSEIGTAIRATGDDEVLAEFFGVRTRFLRIAVFGIGSAMAALAGALQAHRFGLYQPADLGFQSSMLLFVYVLVGGKTSVFGPILGSFFLFVMPEFVKIAPEAELIVFGGLLVVVAVAAPEGLAGIASRLFRLFQRRPDELKGPLAPVPLATKETFDP